MVESSCPMNWKASDRDLFYSTNKYIFYLRFKNLTALKMSNVVFSVKPQYGHVGYYQRFGGKYRLHLQDEGYIHLVIHLLFNHACHYLVELQANH